MAWIANGPVSTPGKGTVAIVAVFIAGAAVVGAGLGFRASLRDTTHASTGVVDDTQGLDQAAPAEPIVDIPAMQAPPPQAAAANTVAAASNAASDDNDDEAASNDIAVRTAAVQAEQSNPAKPAPDVDQQLTSTSERPETPAKPSTDDQPPPGSTPAKSDVPF